MSEPLIGSVPGEDGVATITLTNPPANTYSYEMMRQLDLGILDARMGLVNEVLEAASVEAFMAKVMDKAREFVPPARASKAVGLMKRAVHAGAEAAFTEALGLERELQPQLFESEDAREGLAANFEKRRPEFKGR